jgi:hypothetical protein
LIKPSTAESLVDLQAEFNSLKISISKPTDEEMSGDEVLPSLVWNLQKYYS